MSRSGRHTKYYEFLGVPSTATQDEIRRAYRKLAAKLHPDKSTGNKEKFQELQNIYEILGDEEKRNLYDTYGEEGIKKGVVYERPEAFNQQDLFDLFNQHGNGFFFEFGNGFGGHQRFRRRRQARDENEEPIHRPNAMFAQLLPLIVIFIVYILPYLFESVRMFFILDTFIFFRKNFRILY